jgi:hypothetical protein
MNISSEGAKARRDIEKAATSVIDMALNLHRRAANKHANFASPRLRVYKKRDV